MQLEEDRPSWKKLLPVKKAVQVEDEEDRPSKRKQERKAGQEEDEDRKSGAISRRKRAAAAPFVGVAGSVAYVPQVRP